MQRLTDTFELRDSFGFDVIRNIATGRKTSYRTPEDDSDARLVHEWAECRDPDACLSHDGAARFEQLIKAASIRTETIVAYRGRYESPDMTPYPMSIHFGPPGADDAKENRYNDAHNPVLYLASSKQGVALEVQKEGKSGPLYCQEYRVEATELLTAELRIGNFSDARLHGFVHKAFDYAENGLRNGRVDTEDYSFSRVVAKVVKRCGFSGMIVPGIRGNGQHLYENIVIFDPHPRWERWVKRDRGPEIIDDILG